MESNRWTTELSIAGDEVVKSYVDGYQNYNVDLVRAAIAECEKRGIEIDEQQKREILFNISENFKEPPASGSAFFREQDKNATDDPETPQLYSQRAVRASAIWVNAFFSSFLFAANLRRLGRTDGIAAIHWFGFSHFVTVIIILGQFERPPGVLLIVLNSIAGHFMTGYFWDKYIGENTRYRKRSAAYPMISGILISIIVFLCIVYGL